MEWLKIIAVKYFKEVAVNPRNHDQDELEAMADNFVEDVAQALSARKDFRNADK